MHLFLIVFPFQAHPNNGHRPFLVHIKQFQDTISYNLIQNRTFASLLTAGVVKLVDIPDLGSGAARHGGSSPSARTLFYIPHQYPIKIAH